MPLRDRRRRSIRLRDYDYRTPAAYFVTICVAEREELLGKVGTEGVVLSPAGQVVIETWMALADHFAAVRLDEFVVMPNHVHGVVVLISPENAMGHVGAKHSPEPRSADKSVPLANASPLPRGTSSGSLGAVIQNFKSVSSRRINVLRGTPGAPVWQRNYFERVLRDERELDTARQYIAANPARWYEDRENPNVRTP